MVEEADKIINRYSNLWVDLKNREFTDLPDINIDTLNQQWIKYINDKVLKGPKENKQQLFVNTMHGINNQLHYIRAIKDVEV